MKKIIFVMSSIIIVALIITILIKINDIDTQLFKINKEINSLKKDLKEIKQIKKNNKNVQKINKNSIKYYADFYKSKQLDSCKKIFNKISSGNLVLYKNKNFYYVAVGPSDEKKNITKFSNILFNYGLGFISDIKTDFNTLTIIQIK